MVVDAERESRLPAIYRIPPVVARRDAGRSLRVAAPLGVAAAFGGLIAAGIPLYLATLVPVGAALGAVALLRRRGRLAREAMTDAAFAIRDGNFDAAIEAYEQVLAHERAPRTRAAALGGVAYCFRRQGHFDKALECWQVAREAARHDETLRRGFTHAIASTYALAGDIERARAELGTPDGSLGPVPSHHAIVLARLGQLDRIPELRMWTGVTIQNVLLDHEGRLLALLRAYAMTRLGGHSAQEVHSQVDAARPELDGEYEYLRPNWPEIDAYLATDLWPEGPRRRRAGLPEARTV